MHRSQAWLASLSVCLLGISDTIYSDKDGRVACCEKKHVLRNAPHVCVCVDGTCVPCCKDDVLSATERRHAVCAGRMRELALDHSLLRDGSMFSLWELGRHLQLPSVQVLWCGTVLWTLTHFGRCVHVKRGCLTHVVLMSVDNGCVSVDVSQHIDYTVIVSRRLLWPGPFYGA